MQYATDGTEKYIYFPAAGAEHLFDLTTDRQEERDLYASEDWRDRLCLWRDRLVRLLGERGDGFSDGQELLQRSEWWSPDVSGS